MAGQGSMLKFLNPRLRPQGTDIQAGVFWGVAAASTALWIVQPFDWIRRTFLEKGESEGK